MTTTMEQFPSDVADALRELASTDDFDREMSSLVVMGYFLDQLDAKTCERMLNWAWDRYVLQPKRDLRRMEEQAAAEAVTADD